MASVKNDHVHRLIHSLSRSEKRYFKLHLARHAAAAARSNHALLFDAIAGMDAYDETVLRQRFAGAAFLKHFPIAKRRLYEAILLSLDAYHTDSSVQARLRRMLHQVEILYRRGLYPEAERMLRSVETLAREHHRQPVLLEVVEWRRRLMERTNYEQVRAEELTLLADTAAELLRSWADTEALWGLKSRSFFALYRGGKARSEAELAEMELLSADPRLADHAPAGTPYARYMYHHVRSVLAFSKGDVARCIVELEANAALLAEESALLAEEPDLYLGVLGNLAYLQMRAGRTEEAQRNLKEFRRIPALMPRDPSPDLELRIFAMGASLELALLSRSGRFEAAVERIPEIEEGMSRFGELLGVYRRSGLSFQMAWASLGNDEPQKALRYGRRVTNLAGIDAHPELHGLGRVLNLLLLAETGQWDDLASALRNAERQLKGKERASAFEREMLAFVRERNRARVDSAHFDHGPIREALAQLANDPLEGAVFDHFDPLVWAEARCSGRSMATVAKEKQAAKASKVGDPSKREAA